MGLFDSLQSTNKRKWVSVLDDNETTSELKKIIQDFLIKDNIDFDKYLENQEANSLARKIGLDCWERANSLSIYDEVKNKKINCTPTFRKHFANDRSNRGLGIPDWFYIAYPDVALWLIENNSILEKEMESREADFFVNDKISNSLFRFLIDRYRNETRNKLECSN